MTTKYRIVDFQNKPLGDWTSDRAHLDAYIAEREPDLGKQRVQSTDEIQFRFQSREEFIKGVNAQVEYELAMTADYNEEQFEKAAECAATQHDPNICQYCGSECTDFGKNEPTVYCHDCGREYREPEFMTEEELNARVVKRCPLGHSPRGTTFGGDPLHHSCGCPVLKGEELV